MLELSREGCEMLLVVLNECCSLKALGLGLGELLLNPPWTDVPRAGVLLQK